MSYIFNDILIDGVKASTPPLINTSLSAKGVNIISLADKALGIAFDGKSNLSNDLINIEVEGSTFRIDKVYHQSPMAVIEKENYTAFQFLSTGIPGEFQLDTNFTSLTSTLVHTSTIEKQSNGKYVIGGIFTQIDGVSRNNLARLNADGTLDTSFNVSPSYNGSFIEAMVTQPDDKILIGFLGNFTQKGILRLNTDGSIDNTFNVGSGITTTGVLSTYNRFVFGFAVQPDNKVIIGGDFNSYNGNDRNKIVRLNSDGSLDNTFNIGSGIGETTNNQWVRAIALQSNGKILVGGYFTSYNGLSCSRLIRLNSDGSFDSTFDTNNAVKNLLDSHGQFGVVMTIKVLPNDEILIGLEGDYENPLKAAKLGVNGELLQTFNFGQYSVNVNAIDVLPDGKIIFGGRFENGYGDYVDPTYETTLVIVNPDGTLYKHIEFIKGRIRDFYYDSSGITLVSTSYVFGYSTNLSQNGQNHSIARVTINDINSILSDTKAVSTSESRRIHLLGYK